ncbi:hypothetical protein H9P43_008563, partial [Blastocladiella emersonii ATCC 22665]
FDKHLKLWRHSRGPRQGAYVDPDQVRDMRVGHRSTRLGLPRQAAAALAHQLVGVALKHAPDGVLVHNRVHGEQAHEPAVVAKGASCCGFEDGSKVHSRRHGHMLLDSARSSSSWPRGSPAQGFLSHPPSSSSPPTVYLYRYIAWFETCNHRWAATWIRIC